MAFVCARLCVRRINGNRKESQVINLVLMSFRLALSRCRCPSDVRAYTKLRKKIKKVMPQSMLEVMRKVCFKT